MKSLIRTKKWPELNYSDWNETLDALHLWIQIVGKIRLKTMPWQNHSWHTTLYISPSGFTSQSIPYQGGAFQIDFDFRLHKLILHSTHCADFSFNLKPMSTAEFYQNIKTGLAEIGVDVKIYKRPNELAHNTPFDEDTQPRPYDKQKVETFWEAMVKVNCVFTEFRGQFIGKSSPVHLFWGAFDLAVNRFSGNDAPLHSGGMPNMPINVMQEAYSKEVMSVGFWPGSADAPEPVFYAYCYPASPEFAKQNVLPLTAFYSEDMGEFFLKYSNVQQTDDPNKTLMSFLESTYAAAATTGNWDEKLLTS